MDNSKEVKLTISPQAILTVLGTILALWLIYVLRDIVLLFVMVVALVILFSPLVESWEKRMSRNGAILLLYGLIVGFVLLLAAIVIPVFVSQLSGLLIYIQELLNASGYTGSGLIDRLHTNLNLFASGRNFEAVSGLLSQFQGSLGAVYTTTANIFSGVVAVVTVFVASYYLLADEKNFNTFIGNSVPAKYKAQVIDIKDKISTRMGSWLRGQLLLMLIVGVINGVGLAILGVPYAFLLGLWAGITELFPYVGPVAGAIPGVFIAFTALGPVKALVALVIYIIVQQLESNFLVPKIMGRALGLSPVAVIFALLIGGKLFGFIGLLLAIPVAAVLAVIYEEWQSPEGERK